MQGMIDIDGVIVMTDVLTEHFSCDLAACRGCCCVEGNAGAPLELEETVILEKEFENYREYMTPAGIRAVEEQGFFVVDEDGDLTTTLVGDAECAYVYNEGGMTFCAIEKAYRAGECGFMKPISCHLYPIRVAKFGDGTLGLNYHRWNICSAARANGRKNGIFVYQSLREPIVRRFGEEFYEALEAAAEFLKQEESRS